MILKGKYNEVVVFTENLEEGSTAIDRNREVGGHKG